MKNCKHLIVLMVIAMLNATVALSSADQSGLRIPEQVTGAPAYEHLYYFSEVLGVREGGTLVEWQAANYIMEQFEAMGYDVEVQPFSYERGGTTYYSQNIIATKRGKLDQTVIVGAHYDSASVGGEGCDDITFSTGAGDNASGVAVMLEAAEVLAEYKTHGTVKFIAFGAEEKGLKGSRYYADQMSEEEVANTVTMINLDSVGAGDFFYVYSGLDNNPGWARDLALNIGQNIGHDLRTSPDSEYFVGGTTGDWSDHVPFKNLGIPIAYFEWMNWNIEPDGGIETEEFGWIMHTCLDNLEYTHYEKLEQTAEVVASLTFTLSKTKLPKVEKGIVAKGNKYIRIQKRNSLPN